MKKYCLLFCTFLMATLHAQPLVLATYQYADNDRLSHIRPLAEHITSVTGIKVAVKSYPNVHSLLQGIKQGEIAIALINTFGFLLLESGQDAYPMQPSVVMQVPAEVTDNYKTTIIANASNLHSLSQLSGLSKAMSLWLVAPGSTSGNLVPRLALSGVGLKEPEKDFKNFSYAGTHRYAIDSLLASEGPAVAAMGSTEYAKLQKEATKAGKWSLLWMSPEIPLGPVLIHNRLSDETKGAIRQILLSLHTKNPIAFNAVKTGWSEAREATHYVPYDPSIYTRFISELGDAATRERILQQFLW